MLSSGKRKKGSTYWKKLKNAIRCSLVIILLLKPPHFLRPGTLHSNTRQFWILFIFTDNLWSDRNRKFPDQSAHLFYLLFAPFCFYSITSICPTSCLLAPLLSRKSLAMSQYNNSSFSWCTCYMRKQTHNVPRSTPAQSTLMFTDKPPKTSLKLWVIFASI